MRIWLMTGCFFLFACGTEPTQTTVASTAREDSSVAPVTNSPASDTDDHFAKDTEKEDIPVVPPTKKPSGIYRFVLPSEEGEKILQTIAFYPTTYRLQEEYGKEDSTVVTEGTWTPSQGTIWLYKEQLVRGRYKWKGDTLQYFSPGLKRNYSMEKLTPATTNKVWQTKKQQGTQLYGLGNEPFWSVEVTDKDSILLNMPEWTAPLQVKVSETNIAKDSTVYLAENDSLKVTVYPLFCNDGMSDFLYTRRVKVQYRGQILKGCGEVLRQAH